MSDDKRGQKQETPKPKPKQEKIIKEDRLIRKAPPSDTTGPPRETGSTGPHRDE